MTSKEDGEGYDRRDERRNDGRDDGSRKEIPTRREIHTKGEGLHQSA